MFALLIVLKIILSLFYSSDRFRSSKYGLKIPYMEAKTSFMENAERKIGIGVLVWV